MYYYLSFISPLQRRSKTKHNTFKEGAEEKEENQEKEKKRRKMLDVDVSMQIATQNILLLVNKIILSRIFVDKTTIIRHQCVLNASNSCNDFEQHISKNFN